MKVWFENQFIRQISERRAKYGQNCPVLVILDSHSSRNSIDIDLFTVNDFDVNLLLEVLNQFYTVKQIYIRKNTLLTFINDVKVDFITHKYEIIRAR